MLAILVIFVKQPVVKTRLTALTAFQWDSISVVQDMTACPSALPHLQVRNNQYQST